jgi:hypothetical protein
MPPDPSPRLTVIAETRQHLDGAPDNASWVGAARQTLERETVLVAAQIRDREHWAAAHRRDGQRLAQLTAAVDHRMIALSQMVAAGPDPWLIDLLGPQPSDSQLRREWVHAATDLAAWQELSDRPAGCLLDPLQPSDPQRAWLQLAFHAVEHSTETRDLGSELEPAGRGRHGHALEP